MKNWLYPLWVIIDILIFLATIGLWITAPEFKTLNIVVTVFASTLGFLLVVIKLENIKELIRSQYFRSVMSHLTNIFLVLCIFGVLNYVGNKNFKEFDLTIEKRNSLTDQSLKVIEMIKSPLRISVFSRREEWSSMLNLLKLYGAQSKFISIDAIDTDVRRDLVESKKITQNGTVIIEYLGKETSFPLIDELSLTNGLLKALRSDKIVLYFITGHQEISCSETSEEGLSVLCEKLKSLNYEVKDLDLTKVDRVPSDASGLFVMGPISGYLKEEVAVIKKYIDNGGSFFLALAPAFKAEIYDNLTALAKPFGLLLGKDIVIDRLSTVQGAEATIPIINKYESNHPITEGFSLRTVFPLSSSVSTIEGKDTAQIIAHTSQFPGSWAETDLKAVTLGKAKFDEKTDQKGPVGLMGVAEGVGQSTSRIVLLGSSSFLVNGYQSQSGNTTLFLNSVSWIVNDEGIISLNRPGVEEFPVILSSQHLQMIFIIAILVIPIIFFATAIFVYRRRRLL
jgi:ABC-type uncharacterized transport system involved in gliding motility auxiliary subunit